MLDLFFKLGISEVYPYTTWQLHFPTDATFRFSPKSLSTSEQRLL